MWDLGLGLGLGFNVRARVRVMVRVRVRVRVGVRVSVRVRVVRDMLGLGSEFRDRVVGFRMVTVFFLFFFEGRAQKHSQD